jgi:hypothetical protein
MAAFLNNFMEKYREIDDKRAKTFEDAVERTVKAARKYLGDSAFRPAGTLNAAVFDSVMIGLDERLRLGEIKAKPEDVRTRYERLLLNSQYEKSYRRATADEESVSTRMRLAVEAFADLT